MPRLRNTRTGVVVNVDDGTAARLSAEWVEDKPETAKRPARQKKTEK